MSKKSTTVTKIITAATSASSIASDILNDLVSDKLTAKAEVVLREYIRKDDERQTSIAEINVAIKEANSELAILEGKLAKAEKVMEAEVAELQTLRTAAAERRDTFIESFDSNPYEALADSTLVLDFVAKKVAKVA